jgi:hypothetical protein
MTRGTGWGAGRGVNGQEAATEALHRALNQLGTGRPVLATVFFSQDYDVADIARGLAAGLPNIPIWGISTACPLTADGEQSRSVVLGVLAGHGLKAEGTWLPGYAQDSSATALAISKCLQPGEARGALLAADGIGGNGEVVTRGLQSFLEPIAGCLASCDDNSGKTYQLCGKQYGSGGVSLVTLGGRFRLSAGVGHGWQNIGASYAVTSSRDVWVQGLDNQSPAEIYGQIFGFPAHDWGFPPLSHLVRLYPFGVESEPEKQGSIRPANLRAALHVEPNGSFRMNACVEEGQVVSILVGDREACLQAARQAAQDAATRLQQRGKVRALMGLVLVDLNWRHLFQGQIQEVIDAVRSDLGDIPLLGAYTLGQIASAGEKNQPEFLNGHILVALIGETEA